MISNPLIPSKKTQNMVITLVFIIGAMVLTGVLNLPEVFATNALYVIAAVGGVTVMGQAYSDKVAGGSSDDSPRDEVVNEKPFRRE